MTRVLTAIAAVVVAAAGPGATQVPVPAVDATLTVRLPAGRSTWVLGEIIPLELEFSGMADADFYFSTETYDRSGRMRTERYQVSPEDAARDPLADFYASVGAIGGGLRGWHALDGRPLTIRVTLNEWVQFVRPGQFTLSVTSRRLHRHSGAPAPTLQAAPVVLEIQPPLPDWPAAQAARAIALLETEAGQEEGVAILRHLGTPEAALALTAAYGSVSVRHRFDLLAGLVASPFQADVVAAMESRIDNGELVPHAFIQDAALIRWLHDGPSRPRSATAHADRVALESAHRLRWLSRAGTSPEALRAFLEAVAETTDPVFATGVAAELNARPAAASRAFLSLPAATQRRLLQVERGLDRAWLEPALVSVFEQSRGDHRFPGVGDVALERLLALDAARYRPLLIDEIRTGTHGLAPGTLLALADTLPASLIDDETLRRRFDRSAGNGRASSLWLIARFGSADLVPFVRDVLGRGAACALEAAALAYLLLHDPDTAVARLDPSFDRRAICVVPPWQELAARHWDSRVETAALLHARDGGVRDGTDAIRILGSHGSFGAKGPLLDRLDAWASQWRGRAGEFTGGAIGFDGPGQLEYALVDALLANPRFSLTPGDLARIRAACVTARCHAVVDARRLPQPAWYDRYEW